MLMMVSTSAFAQFANAGASSTSSATDTGAWQGVTASYNIGSLSYDIDGAEDIDFNGFSIGFVKAFSISKSLPLFVETGLNLAYATGEQDCDYWSGEAYHYVEAYNGYHYDAATESCKMEYTYFGLTVPVNLAYKYTINDDLQVIPFTGIYFRGNLVAKGTHIEDEVVYCPYYDETIVETEEDDYDFFDDKEVEDTWNRFNFGWQIGAKVAYKQFTAGISYGLDLNEIAKKGKMNNLSISVGYNF